MSIPEMDCVIDALMNKLKDDSEKNVNVRERRNQAIRKFIKCFDAFYDEADTFIKQYPNKIKCEIDPWLVLED